MSYIDAYHNQKTDEIYVVERTEDGKREFKTYPAKHVFYHSDKKGSYKTIFGTSVSKYETTDEAKFRKDLASMRGAWKIYESDVSPLFRCLADNYLGHEAPELHIGIFDIEVNFNPEKGFASPEHPYAEINAISVHLSWLDTLITLVLKPDTITTSQAEEVVRKFDNTVLCESEADLLKTFLDLIDDVDVISGWNSEMFDVPYTIERIKTVLGKDFTRQLCLWNILPKQRMVEKFGKEQMMYELAGRVSLDYLDLFKKHSMQQYHSYRLDFIGEQEVGERKTAYEGTLDNLYKNDFYKFIEYNRQDVLLLVKIDKKNKFIDLANQVAHTNGVLLKTTMGSVQLIDQAIINEAHRRGMVVHDKIKVAGGVDEELGAAGAYVADPKVGLHDDIGAVDINSLYPSVIRSLNMCTETLVGQLEQTNTKKIISERIAGGMSPSDAWHGMFGSVEYTAVFNRNENFDICLELGNVDEPVKKRYLTADETHDFIFNENNKYCISANGTIFRTDIEGVIPGLLTKWYNERKTMQATKKDYSTMKDKGIEISEELAEKLRNS